MTSFLIIMGVLLIGVPLAFAASMYMGFKAPRNRQYGDPSDFDMVFEQVEIPTDQGLELFGWHVLASSDPLNATLLIVHGWGANTQMMLPLADPFYRAGINILLVDARNHGSSPDDGISSLPKFTSDAESSIDWLKKQTSDGGGRIALLGHSVGAGAALLAASRRDDIDAVISISSFAHPLLLMQRHLQRPYKSLIILRMMAPVVMAYTQWLIGYKFDEIAPMNALCKISCPVLLVHGTKDEVIPLSDLRAIQTNCPDKVPEVLLIEGAGHESINKIKQHDKDLVDFLHRCGF